MKLTRSMTATVYVVRNGQVLLHRHKKYHSLFPLGGHMMPGELPQETALREVQEESGLCIRLYHPEQPLPLGEVAQLCLPVQMYHENVGGIPENIDFIFFAETDQEQLRPQDGESRQFAWLTREQIILEPKLLPHIRATALQALEVMNCTDGK